MPNEIIMQYCERCDGYRIFIRQKNSQDPWVCTGSASYCIDHKIKECGYTTTMFREYTNNRGMAH